VAVGESVIWKVAFGVVLGGIILAVLRAVIPFIVLAMIAVVAVIHAKFKKGKAVKGEL
jgi:hypothetical protein